MDDEPHQPSAEPGEPQALEADHGADLHKEKPPLEDDEPGFEAAVNLAGHAHNGLAADRRIVPVILYRARHIPAEV